jgi:hypothetical protein
MFRIKALVILMVCIAFPVISQTIPTYDDLEQSFAEFSEGVASTLPFNALTGLTWSDAHIKNFPHFGLGATVGATFMPYINLEETLTLLGVDLATLSDSEIGSILEEFGMPFPSVSLEARIGGFFLPFDLGIKVGFIPQDFDLSVVTEGFALNYFSIGGDLRFRVLKQWFMIPCISVGSGITYQQGSIDIPGILGSNMELAAVGPYSLEMQDPSLNFNWNTLVVDLKTQASWDLFLMTPYIGAGASYSMTASAGGGVKTEILDGATGQPITQAQIDQIIAYYEFLGETPPDLTDTQILVTSETPPAWAFRIYGGMSLNFFILRLDATIMYNIISGGLGGSINARIQF